MLTSRVVTRLRALVVLPTRNLQQVRQIFEACWRGTRLKAIVSDYPVKVLTTTLGRHGHRPAFFYPRTKSPLPCSWNILSLYYSYSLRRLQGGSGKIDTSICTPGRLIDHLNSAINFTLQHLRFLVCLVFFRTSMWWLRSSYR